MEGFQQDSQQMEGLQWEAEHVSIGSFFDTMDSTEVTPDKGKDFKN